MVAPTSKGKAVKILVADYHPLFREGLRHILARFIRNPTIVEAGDFDEAVKVAGREKGIDIVLLDLTMPGGPWHLGIERLRQLLPRKTRIVIVSASEDRSDVSRAVALGASGFIPKTSSGKVFLSALDLIMAGGVYLPMGLLEQEMDPIKTADIGLLSSRQLAVLELVKQGWSNKEIAADIGTRLVMLTHHLPFGMA